MIVELAVYRKARKRDEFESTATRFVNEFNEQPGFPNARRRFLDELKRFEKLGEKRSTGSWSTLSLPDIRASVT